MKNLLLLSLALLGFACGTETPAENSAPASAPTEMEKPDPTSRHSPHLPRLRRAHRTPAERSTSIPSAGAERYTEFGAPDLMLITHTHPDHLDPATLGGLKLGPDHARRPPRP